ncbi:MAG: hypothetical protein LBL02_02470 [Endomicrobium sp.]|jgi:hypothetical protein|nr:hypothetical protein [Endomicrobium sp.]
MRLRKRVKDFLKSKLLENRNNRIDVKRDNYSEKFYVEIIKVRVLYLESIRIR